MRAAQAGKNMELQSLIDQSEFDEPSAPDMSKFLH
jgi:hypothetical protein